MTRTPDDAVEAKVMDAARRTLSTSRTLLDRRAPACNTRKPPLVLSFYALPSSDTGIGCNCSPCRIAGSKLRFAYRLCHADSRMPLRPRRISSSDFCSRAGRWRGRDATFDIRLPVHPAELCSPRYFMPEKAMSGLAENDSIELVFTMHPLEREFQIYPWIRAYAVIAIRRVAHRPHPLFEAAVSRTRRLF